MGTETHSSRRQTPIAWVSQLVFFPFVCLDCFSGREALRAFTQLAYLLSLSHCHIVILCYINIYTSPVSTVVDLALKLRHTANAQRVMAWWGLWPGPDFPKPKAPGLGCGLVGHRVTA